MATADRTGLEFPLITEKETVFIRVACLPPVRRLVLDAVCKTNGGSRTADVACRLKRDISNIGLDLETLRAAGLVVRDRLKVYHPATRLVWKASRETSCVGMSRGSLDVGIGLAILSLAREMVEDELYPGCRTISTTLGITKDVAHAWAVRLGRIGLWPSTEGLHWTDCRARQKTAEAIERSKPIAPSRRPLASPRRGRIAPHLRVYE